MSNQRPTVLVTTRFFGPAAEALLENSGYTVRRHSQDPDETDAGLTTE
jgi:hypothetical protein